MITLLRVGLSYRIVYVSNTQEKKLDSTSVYKIVLCEIKSMVL